MSDEIVTKRDILIFLGRVAAMSAFSYVTMTWLLDTLDPVRKQQLKATEKAKKLLNLKKVK